MPNVIKRRSHKFAADPEDRPASHRFKARKLFDEEKISEGHYLELLHKIGINDDED